MEVLGQVGGGAGIWGERSNLRKDSEAIGSMCSGLGFPNFLGMFNYGQSDTQHIFSM